MRRTLIRFTSSALVLFLGCALPLASSAWGGHFYLAGGLGLQSTDAPISRFAGGAFSCITVTRPLDCQYDRETSSFAPSVFGGVQLNEYAALETGYINLSDTYKVRLTDPNFPSPTQISVDQDSDAFFLRGVFSLPLRRLNTHPWLDKMSASAVLGAMRWRSDLSFVADLRGARGAGFPVNQRSASNVGLGLTFGARVNYDATEQVRLSVAWDRFRDLGNSSAAIPSAAAVTVTSVNTVKATVDVLSFNVSYRFR